MGAVRADSRRRRRSPHGTRICRSVRCSNGTLGLRFSDRALARRPSASRRSRRRTTGAGAGIGRRHRKRQEREVESASGPAGGSPSGWCGVPEPAAYHHRQGAARPRHHRAVLLGCALRRSQVAALTDGRCSGGFTEKATVAAPHANAPELSVWAATPSARRPSARRRSHRRTTGNAGNRARLVCRMIDIKTLL
jgi:hypothetical protein